MSVILFLAFTKLYAASHGSKWTRAFTDERYLECSSPNFGLSFLKMVSMMKGLCSRSFSRIGIGRYRVSQRMPATGLGAPRNIRGWGEQLSGDAAPIDIQHPSKPTVMLSTTAKASMLPGVIFAALISPRRLTGNGTKSQKASWSWSVKAGPNHRRRDCERSRRWLVNISL